MAGQSRSTFGRITEVVSNRLRSRERAGELVFITRSDVFTVFSLQALMLNFAF